MELPIITHQGKETGRKATLPTSVFGIQPNDHAIYLAIKHLQANQRQGTHKTKGRAEIQGSTRKIQKQKGSGNARKGNIKANILRGGGRVFGPTPRDYSFKLNKKQKKLARKSALSYKAQKKQIQIIENFSLEQPKTKNYLSILNSLSIKNKKTLLVLSKPDKNIILAARNLKKAKVTTLAGLNTYNILNSNQLLLSESTLSLIEKKLCPSCKS